LVAGIGLNQGPFTADVKTVNLTTVQQTFEVFLTSNFANANSRVIFDMGADTGTVVIDDVVLVVDTSTPPPPPAAGGPTVAAPLPTAAAANVTSIFSDSYTNLTVGAFGPDFGPFSSRITDGVIAGNNFKTMDVTAGKTFGAVSFAPSKFNATAFTTFHMDYWIDTPIPAGQVLSIKLSNHDGATPGETSAIQSTVTNITGGSWQRISIPLNSFEQAATSLSRNNIAEIIITAARANTAEPVKVHFDNMYFSR
jgi:endoglucanase